MHIILTGATGLVGSGALDAMLGMKEISKISILSRRPVQMAEDRKDPRVDVILHKDFTKYDDPVLLSKLSDADGCVWALGISQTQVDATEYVNITKTFSVNFAEAFSKVAARRQEPFHFAWVSGAGATHSPGMLTPRFGVVKGETEVELAKIRESNPFFVASSIRPAFVDGSGHEAAKEYIPPAASAAAGVGRAVLPALVRAVAKGSWSPTLPLGRFLARTAMGKLDGELARGGSGIELVGPSKMPVVENHAIRKIMGW
ncbi:putative nucleoside-diphosphate-sugar epimerase [Zalerion maritima]|uniref:Nucleoside-diphosphate-sugar epimerase n=1 Tax=Zalerion maritima TaxID=339359 RepID=A0AAD5RHV0_9PEZI|nr:putative nucleoside-diphosphate-sugar epimerase [Zalerion maritima]